MEERLQKLIAAAGIASRRKAEELILEGAVTVNGRVVTELGTKADPERDHIKVNGKRINTKIARQEKIYLLLNKPLGYLTSTSDPQGRPLVIDLIGKYRAKVHPVGRLDFNTEGLLLLTNDGDFTNLITAAKSKVPKYYEVKVKGKPSEGQLDRLRRGIVIDEAKTAPARIREMSATEVNSWYEVVLHEGRNQQIRKMFDSIGHSVLKLRRVAIGFISDKRLRPGAWRELDEVEVRRFLRLQRPAKPAVEKRERGIHGSERKARKAGTARKD